MQKELNELEEQALIQAFEYTHELAWKTQKTNRRTDTINCFFLVDRLVLAAFKPLPYIICEL